MSKNVLLKTGEILLPAVTGFLACMARTCFSLRAYNIDKVPRSGPAIIASNHPTFLDPPLLYGTTWIHLQRRIAFMAASWIFKLPIAGPWLPLFGAYSVDKNIGKRNPFLKTLELLEQGELVGLFLEGTVSSGVLLNDELKSGPVRASLKTNAPIIPATIIGGHNTWPQFKNWKLPRLRPVQVIYHEPFYPQELGLKNDHEIIKASNEILRETINAPLKNYFADNYPERRI